MLNKVGRDIPTNIPALEGREVYQGEFAIEPKVKRAGKPVHMSRLGTNKVLASIDEAIEKAVVAVDACVKDVIEAAKAQDYEAIIIADHGNADHALNEDGTPNTAHSLNPVPFVYVTENKNAKVENGVLADVAPSILHILGMPQPADMTGRDLIK